VLLMSMPHVAGGIGSGAKWRVICGWFLSPPERAAIG